MILELMDDQMAILFSFVIVYVILTYQSHFMLDL